MRAERVIRMAPIDEGKYRGEWLALHPETHEVLAHGKILKNVVAEAKHKGYESPVLHGVPESDIYFVEVA